MRDARAGDWAGAPAPLERVAHRRGDGAAPAGAHGAEAGDRSRRVAAPRRRARDDAGHGRPAPGAAARCTRCRPRARRRPPARTRPPPARPSRLREPPRRRPRPTTPRTRSRCPRRRRPSRPPRPRRRRHRPARPLVPGQRRHAPGHPRRRARRHARRPRQRAHHEKAAASCWPPTARTGHCSATCRRRRPRSAGHGHRRRPQARLHEGRVRWAAAWAC